MEHRKVFDFKIVLYSHFFKIKDIQPYFRNNITEFIRPLIQFEMDRAVGDRRIFRPVRTFAIVTKDGKECRLHINQLQEFLDFLKRKGIPVYDAQITKAPKFGSALLSHKYKFTKSPRPKQEEALAHTFKCLDTGVTSLLGMPTGTGKTFTGLYAASKINKRTVIFLLPTYIPKWVDDIQENMHVSPKAIITVQGSPQLRGIIEMGYNNEITQDFILVSISTVQNFINEYVADPDGCVETYGCNIEDFCNVLKAGNVMIDETHQHIHAVFRIMLMLHCHSLISLSATLIAGDPLIQKVHDIMYPKACRFDSMLMNKYIKVIAVDYSFRDFAQRKIQTAEFRQTTYSHLAYERSIIKRHNNLQPYMAMIAEILKIGYIDRRVKGDKAVIFVAKIDMCILVRDYLRKLHPNLDIRKYNAEDNYENILSADISVTTIQSAGTAVDIPNLITAIMTVVVTAPIPNLQSLGRLRQIDGKEMRYYYLYCTNIKKHVMNHYVRKELFYPKAESIKELRYEKLL